MALIKCNECGHEVSDKASVCPNCGNPIRDGHVCCECGTIITEGLSTCPNCGCPTKSKDSSMTTIPQIVYKDPPKKEKGLFYIIGIVGYIILSVIACALERERHSSSSNITSIGVFAAESVYCTGAAILMICIVAGSWIDRLILSVIAFFLLLLFFEIGFRSNENIVGMAILEFITHFTLIIIAVYRRK